MDGKENGVGGGQVGTSPFQFAIDRRDKDKAAKTPNRSGKNKKPRTPSGQILTTSVKDIRNFFASGQQAPTYGAQPTVTPDFGFNFSLGNNLALTSQAETTCSHSVDGLNRYSQSGQSRAALAINRANIFNRPKCVNGKLKETSPAEQNKQCSNKLSITIADLSLKDNWVPKNQNQDQGIIVSQIPSANCRLDKKSQDSVNVDVLNACPIDITGKGISFVINKQSKETGKMASSVSINSDQSVAKTSIDNLARMQMELDKTTSSLEKRMENTHEQPQLMDVQTVITMFRSISQQMSEVVKS